MPRVMVTKMDGTKEPYRPEKLAQSLRNAGADEDTIQHILKATEKELYEGVPTKHLYKFAFRELKKHERPAAAKYNLKRAMLDLGPEGYPFESYVARLLEKKGYSVKTQQIVRGKHIPHEIDVIARRDGQGVMVECKHHKKPWIYCDVQTALYVYARFLDCGRQFSQPMLVTNTKFSGQAMKYSKGVGMRLMGWKYPKGDSLELNIEKYKLWPVTTLTSLSASQKKMLMDEDIVLASQVKDIPSRRLAKMAGTSQKKAQDVISEAEKICE